MPSTVETEEFLVELVALAMEKPFSHWKHVPDANIQIPDDLTKLGAYFRYLDRGCVHGFHVDDYFGSLADLRLQFRQCVASMEVDACNDYDERANETNGGC